MSSANYMQTLKQQRKTEVTICRRKSICLSSVVGNVRAPYSAGWNFRQGFYAIWYLGHPINIHRKFYEDRSRGTSPLRRSNARGVAEYSDFVYLSKAISRKRCNCKIGSKLVLVTNKTSHMSFRLVPKSVTLNDLELQCQLPRPLKLLIKNRLL